MNLRKFIRNIIVLSSISIVTLSLVSAKVYADNAGDWITGKWSGKTNNLNLASTVKGDMLFGYNNGSNYGKWTHVALTLEASKFDSSSKYPKQSTGSSKRSSGWDGRTIEATSLSKNQKNAVYKKLWQSHFRRYDAAAHTWVNIKVDKDKVVDKAKNYSGKYTVFTKYITNSAWYCTKLASHAYYDVTKKVLGGDKVATWPQTLYYDKRLVYVTGSQSSKYDGGSVFKKAKLKKSSPEGITVSSDELNTDKEISSLITNGNFTPVSVSEKNNVKQKYLDELRGAGKNPSTLTVLSSFEKTGFLDFFIDAVKKKQIDLSNEDDLHRFGLTKNQAKYLLDTYKNQHS